MFDELAWNPKFEITSEPEPDEELLVSSDMLIEKTPELPGIEFGTANPDNSPVMFGSKHCRDVLTETDGRLCSRLNYKWSIFAW